jgi:hypothetical protein
MRPISGSPYAGLLVTILGTILLLQLAFQEFVAMWSKPRAGPLVALVSSSALSAVAQSVDLSWHAPSQTLINNLTNVVTAKGVYGFIYDTSDTPDSRYGTYNWCNMPHVRVAEYEKPPSDYELGYVELVRLESFLWSVTQLTRSSRSTATTSALRMRPTRSLLNPITGIAMTKGCFTSVSTSTARKGQPSPTGAASSRRSTRSDPLGLSAAASFPRSLRPASTTRGSMDVTSTPCIMTCWASYRLGTPTGVGRWRTE